MRAWKWKKKKPQSSHHSKWITLPDTRHGCKDSFWPTLSFVRSSPHIYLRICEHSHTTTQTHAVRRSLMKHVSAHSELSCVTSALPPELHTEAVCISSTARELRRSRHVKSRHPSSYAIHCSDLILHQYHRILREKPIKIHLGDQWERASDSDIVFFLKDKMPLYTMHYII